MPESSGSVGDPDNASRSPRSIERVIWDLTYACPLRCVHCMTESGRRAARTLSRAEMLRVAETIVAASPGRVALSGGEPLLPRWWAEAAERLSSAGLSVIVFTSGWLMDEARAQSLAGTVDSVHISVDGWNAEVHDYIRGRPGSFERCMSALETLQRVQAQRAARGERIYKFGVDVTVTRSGMAHLDRLVEAVTQRFPRIAFVRLGAVVPVGLAQEKAFVEQELLTFTELDELAASAPRLEASAANGVEVSVTDVRYFIPGTAAAAAAPAIAHIEPDGQMRAFTNYEAKVGNVLEEPLETLWQRALAWWADPFVKEQFKSLTSLEDWARVTRTLDRRYGSAADKERLARRGPLPARRLAPAVVPTQA